MPLPIEETDTVLDGVDAVADEGEDDEEDDDYYRDDDVAADHVRRRRWRLSDTPKEGNRDREGERGSPSVNVVEVVPGVVVVVGFSN